MPQRKSTTDDVIDAWILKHHGMNCERASRICRGKAMMYRKSDGTMVKCLIDNIGPLTGDGQVSGITISFTDNNGNRHERNTLVSRLVDV